ncbi:hypothetical protein ACH9EU_05725 [Kocuria sp. M1R5S2]|uniref:hypothetical protein n=1 Tax=Kocuria rhizosphaerae TaxID=3376285 RepID=UPI0037B28A37
MYGRTEDEWEQLRESAVYHLEAAAKSRSTIDYSTLNHQIADETGLPPFDFTKQTGRDAIAQLLAEISEDTHARHGIMLSALVTHKGSANLGGGFYKLASKLGQMPANPTTNQKDEALSRLTAEVHDHYARRASAR